MTDPPVLGTKIRVWLTTVRFPGAEYIGTGVVRSVDPVKDVPHMLLVECVVQTDDQLPDGVLTWTILKWEPAH